MNPHDVAARAYAFWRSVGYNHDESIAWLSDQDGETSCIYSPPPIVTPHTTFPVGDHGTAKGPFQHHAARIAEIKEKTGIDLADPNLTLENALKAADWESSPGGARPYDKVRGILKAATTKHDRVAALVHFYEGSRLQDRDIARRSHLYDYWDPIFKS